MSKRSERNEAERLDRRRAYLAAREAQAQPEAETEATQPPAVSEARLTANRTNALLSTGPTSTAGKAIASRNHTSHGLTATTPIDGTFKVAADEDQSAYDNALTAFKAEWKPVTATELDLVERLATHSWLRRRSHRLRDELLDDIKDYKMMSLYHRYFVTHERAFNKAFSDLMRLRSFQMREQSHQALLEKRAQDVLSRFESQKRKAEEHAAKMETLRLKQEAQKQRNLRTTSTETPVVSEIAITQSA